jgi:prepilin-type N-terminal cleavage/methylation domain-containing protein
MNARRRAFTLIELLTVIAVTAILLTIIIIPLVDSFNLLRAGQGWSEAQERARLLLDKIGSEIQKSAFIRDNSGTKGQIAIVVPSGPGSADPTVTEFLPYAKLDLLKPAQGEPQVDALGNPVYVDPVTGKIDPTLKAPKGQPLLPAAAGTTLVRYFIGLHNPFLGQVVANGPGFYNNPYDGLLMQRDSSRDNLFVVYRAEVQPFTYVAGKYVPNTAFFATDVNGNIILDDPSFFIPDGTLAKATRIQNWLAASVVQTEVSRYDMVLPQYNKNNRAVAYDLIPPGDYAPRLVPLLQFRPTRVSNEPAQPQRIVRPGEESDNSQLSGPDVIRTDKGAWENPIVRTYPVPLNGAVNPATNYYEVGRNGTRSDGSFGFSIYQIDPTLGGDDTASGTELWDYTQYENDVTSGTQYPFSDALNVANGRSGWLGNALDRQLFAPSQPDTVNGQLLASFNIDEVGTIPLAPGTPNLPVGNVGTDIGANVIGAVYPVAAWAGPTYTINDAFNYAFQLYNGVAHSDLRAGLQRFLDLRTTANADGTYGPLFPSSVANFGGVHIVVNGNANSFPRATIVPGSETVWGPDQNAGPNLGNEVRYTRTTQTPGPNQYRINYVHQPEPTDYGVLGISLPDLAGFNPNVYDPTNFISAVIQARYEPGYIELNSDPNIPIPSGNGAVPFRVSYRFQFTSPLDAYAVDYDSAQLMGVYLTIRNMPGGSVPNPQTVTLKTTATVRNFLR